MPTLIERVRRIVEALDEGVALLCVPLPLHMASPSLFPRFCAAYAKGGQHRVDLKRLLQDDLMAHVAVALAEASTPTDTLQFELELCNDAPATKTRLREDRRISENVAAAAALNLFEGGGAC